jgi:hypothetical protein
MKLWNRIRYFAKRKEIDRQLQEEMRVHQEMAREKLGELGEADVDARDRSRKAFGNTTLAAEDSRAAWTFPRFSSFVQDLRYGFRMLWKSPGFSVVAVLTLALGIGATTAIFSAVNPILFEPLPYPRASRILTIWDTFQGKHSDVTFHTYREVAARNRSFESISVLEPWQPTMTGPAEPERLDGLSVSANYFRVLGVAPAMGRDFNSTEDVLHGPKVADLSDGL